jgi:hypothetical protein
MKSFLKYAVVVSLACMVFACGDKDEVVDPVLTIGATDLTQEFTADGGTKAISVTANGLFTAVADADQDWLTITNVTYSATAESFFRINVAVSKVFEARTAKVTVALEGATSIVITVNQEEGQPDRDFLQPTGIWTVAKPGDIEWFTHTKDVDTKGSEGVPATKPVAIIDDGPGGIKAWALTAEDHIKVYSPLSVPAIYYTLSFDIRVNEKPGPGYIPLFQPRVTNVGDAAAFFRASSATRDGVWPYHLAVGYVSSYSDSIVTYKEWHRIVATVDIAGSIGQMYLDGDPITKPDGTIRTKEDMSTPDNDARFSIQSVFYLFLDNDWEDGAIDVAGFAAWDTFLTAEQVKALGNAEKRIY